MSGKAEVTLR